METNELTFDNLTALLEDYGKRAEAYYRENLANNGKNASHTLSESAHYKLRRDGNTFEVSMDLAKYWYWVDEGRKPGKFPPKDAILQWIRVKPIIPLSQMPRVATENSLAYLIGRKIARKGIPATHSLREAVRRTDNELLDKLAAALSADLTNEIYYVVADSFAKNSHTEIVG